MNFEHVNFFMTCAACLNFSLAAKHHFVSVSTLSRSITALEDELGVKLFKRGYHGHILTEAGKDFFEFCVNSSMELNKYLMRWSTRGKDVLRIGCYPGNPAFARLINSCAKMPADYLSKNVKIEFVNKDDFFYALDSGYLDLVVLKKDDDFDYEAFKTSEFFSDGENEFVFVAGKSVGDTTLHKLSSLKKYL